MSDSGGFADDFEEISNTQTLVVGKERLGVLIGTDGSTKRRIEEETGVELEIDSQSGRVTINNDGAPVDVFMATADVVRAIGLGFNPHKALRLLDREFSLHSVALSDFVKDSRRNLRRVKGRIIGEDGKTREIIEETTDCYVSVYKDTVSLIGPFDGLINAKEAISMLIEGKPHKVVYNFLFSQREQQKLDRMRML